MICSLVHGNANNVSKKGISPMCHETGSKVSPQEEMSVLKRSHQRGSVHLRQSSTVLSPDFKVPALGDCNFALRFPGRMLCPTQPAYVGSLWGEGTPKISASSQNPHFPDHTSDTLYLNSEPRKGLMGSIRGCAFSVHSFICSSIQQILNKKLIEIQPKTCMNFLHLGLQPRLSFSSHFQ